MERGDVDDGRPSKEPEGLPALGRVRLGGAIALLLALFVAVLATLGSGSGAEPQWDGVVGEFELRQRSYTFSHSAYWLGPQDPFDSYQLEIPATGDIYIRYLDDPDESESTASLLTVATYQVPDAAAALASAAMESGERVSRHPGFELLADSSGTSAYLVLEGVPELQIEIYSPRPGEAAKLAKSGAISRLR